MIKKSFIGLTKPRLEYEVFTGAIPEPRLIPVPETVTLMIEGLFGHKDQTLLKAGEAVKVGQKLTHAPDDDSYSVATVGGTIRSVSAYTGDFSKSYTAVAIEVNEGEDTDEAFAEKTTLPSPIFRSIMTGFPFT